MEYKSLKNIFILTSIVLIVENFVGIGYKIPVLDISLSKLNDLIKFFIYLFIYVLTILHLYIESEKLKYRFELNFNTIIFIIVSNIMFWDFVKTNKEELLSSLIFDYIFSYILYLFISELSYIRSRKEANRLNLPRIPNSVLSILLFSIIINSILVYLWLNYCKNNLNYSFVRNNLVYLILMPIIFHLIYLLKDDIIIIFKLKGWKEKKKNKKDIKEIKNSHDMDYEFFSNFPNYKLSQSSNEIYSYIKTESINSIDKYYDNGNDPNEVFSHGYTALIFASAEGKIESLKKIIEHGAEIDIKNSKGRTALYYSCKYNYFEIVKILLNNGANPNVCYFNTDSPLQIASINGAYESVELLLKCEHIDVNMKNINNKNALELAMENNNGKIAKLIRNKIKSIF